VTPEHLRRVARKILGRPERSVVLLGPRPSRAVARKLGKFKRVK
jgi:hypothetical protein